MSVNLLLCEGGDRSPDVRVLAKLLGGACTVKPMDGKYGMGNRILDRRKLLAAIGVFGLLDGDFLKDWQDPQGVPQVWAMDSDQIHLGWRWERKEIENYLLDPVVVAGALGAQAPDRVKYGRALDSARDAIAIYQAARIALSVSRIRFRVLPSSFGPAKGKDNHCFPDQLDEESCRKGIIQIVSSHQTGQSVQEGDVLNAFQTYLPECQPGGSRYQHYLSGFSGKDLFFAMDEWFKDNGFAHANLFREKVLVGIESTTDDVADWVPEWGALRQTIGQT